MRGLHDRLDDHQILNRPLGTDRQGHGSMIHEFNVDDHRVVWRHGLETGFDIDGECEPQSDPDPAAIGGYDTLGAPSVPSHNGRVGQIKLAQDRAKEARRAPGIW